MKNEEVKTIDEQRRSHQRRDDQIMTPSSYQFLPPLLPEDSEALKTSIAEQGVDVPIIVDQEGNVIDGHHRKRACDELGIFCPRVVRHFESEAEKLELILRLNFRRRQLRPKQRRLVIKAYILRDPEICPTHLAELIGVSKNTVADVRSEMETTCQIDKFDKLRGKDGKYRPVKYKRIIANTAKEVEAALKLIGDLPDNCAGKTLDVTTATRRARRNLKKQEREGHGEIVGSNLNDGLRLFNCRFQKLESVAGLAPNSVDLIFTDIP